jgi:acyl transferase domain-containing protein/NADPH:quinone reductase-like Zn-dependent oxidoreductase/NAD(P)-dependent dehydrogenase (short-subunit alcohol dehydrogenase family)/acyl carrier protein
MTASIEEYRARLREALTQLVEMEAALDEADRTRAEPIAIVGMACRVPGGGNTPEAFFDALLASVDAVTEVPPERWPAEDRTGRWGAFLEGVDRFEPGFFGISPREAAALDPQQRLLLEVAWEALERAGQVPERLSVGRTGVFVGITNTDYYILSAVQPPEQLEIYAGTGNGHCFPPGRISYTFGFVGPSMAIDTACSSSLVAVHVACQSLRTGDCDVALAGGVNLMLTPFVSTVLARSQALAPDGRCKTFDASANGYVRGEGCGVVVLKRLSDAQRDRDPILALIRGSAVNQDGRSAGLTAPNVLSQQALVRKALENAGLSPEDIGYIETHGTGTPLGDPIELDALGAVLGAPRGDGTPCFLGAVKTNIGHLEPAAGVVGLIKAVMALQRGVIPRNLHFRALNPRISLEGTPFVIPTENTPFPPGPKRRIAGVSSFGMSGTNAHVILEEAPPASEPVRSTEASAYLLPLSARNPRALSELAVAYANALRDHERGDGLHDIVYTASVRRTHHEHRAVAVAGSRLELADLLAGFARGETPAGLARGQAAGGRPRVVFVFSGQGSQWLGMGRQLLVEEPVFRAALEACDVAIAREAGFSVLEELAADEAHSRLGEIDTVQPILFAMEVALAALWRSWGVEPDCVVGHSMGEVAAAHVAGIVSLPDAAAVICRRSRILRRVSGKGAMALVELTIEEAELALAGHEGKLGVAVSNGPRSTVISGDPGALEQVLSSLERRGVFCRRVKVDVASHSPQMDPLREDLLAALRDVSPREAALAMRSTVTGEVLRGHELVAGYWMANLRQPVRFAAVMKRLMEEGSALFVEISPHPVLLPSIEESLKALAQEGEAIASLRRHLPERRCMLEALGALYVRGYPVDWARLYPAGGRSVLLPPYPWQRERYWLESGEGVLGEGRGKRPSLGSGAGLPLLGEHLISSTRPGEHFWEQWVTIEALPYLADHRVQGEIAFPGAGYVDMALRAGAAALGVDTVVLEEISFERLLGFPPEGGQLVQVALAEEEGGCASIEISSREEGRKEWVRRATGKLRVAAAEGAPRAIYEPPRRIQERCTAIVEPVEHYARMEARGLHYGPSFRGVERIWMGTGEALGRARLPEGLAGEAGAHGIHPVLLDACFQVAGALLSSRNEGTLVPVDVGRVRLHGRVPAQVWVHARLAPSAGEAFAAELSLLDEDGRIVAEIGALHAAPLDMGRETAKDRLDECVYVGAWRRKDLVAEASLPRLDSAWLVLLDGHGVGAGVVEHLRALGESCVEALPAARYERVGPAQCRLDLAAPEQLERLFTDFFGKERACRGVLHCASLDAAPWEDTNERTLQQDIRRGSLSALRVAQAIVRQGFRDTPRLFMATRGAQAVGPGAHRVSVSQSPLWGLARTISFEHPELECTRIDLPVAPLPDELDLLVRELIAGDGEDQIALREEGRFIARFARSTLAVTEEVPHHLEAAAGRPFRLEMREPGVLERLSFREMTRKPPGPGEVEIEIEAAGLNFIDVMKAMGIYPGLPPGPVALGGECAGRIVAVGEGVTGLSVGQEVIAVAPACFATHVTAMAAFVVPKPSKLSFEEAACIPAVFTTVQWALDHVGRLRRGERILIHAASGGTGLAAIQVARATGAEIFATAGSEEKRAFLRSMHIEHVMDSRSLAFADELMKRTAGRGVDVVLNTLTGDAATKSLEVLAPYGRFLELGKKDIYQNGSLGLRPFRKSLSYTAIDLAGMAAERPELFASLLREVMDRLEDGTYSPLPVRTFPAREVDRAFRFMAQAKHTGKIAVRMRDPEAHIVPAEAGHVAILPKASYLITGGLGGLGLSVARWLVDQGARHVALMGRSAPSDAAREAIRSMEEAGAEIKILHADVSQTGEVVRALESLAAYWPPLRGVVHAAGVLDDRTLLQMDEGAFWRPIGPKVLGAWNLHAATRGQPLDFFVMYSSASGLFGSPGQANYTAANAFLDALAHARRQEGLPAMSIQWGTFSEVGLSAAQENRGQRLMSRGIDSFTPEEGTQLLGKLLERPRVEVCLLRLSLRQWLEFYPQAAGMPFLSELRDAEVRGSAAQPGSVRQILERAAPSERQRLIEEHLIEQISHVLRLPGASIDPRAPFTTLGMDSLMSLELRNRLEASLSLRLSAALLFTYPSVVAMAAYLAGQLQAEDKAPAPRAEEAAPAPKELDDDLLAAFDASLRKVKTENLR